MSSNPPTNTPAPAPSDYRDDREERRAERAARRAARREMRGNTAWIGGVVLIALGIIFLLQNAGFPTIDNWWALFILIPAAGALATAWNMYRANGQFTSAMIGSLGVGIVLLLVTAGFLFNLEMSLIFPVALILIGLGALSTALLRPR